MTYLYILLYIILSSIFEKHESIDIFEASFQHADFSASVKLSTFKHHNQLECQKKSAEAEKIVRKKVEL